MRAVCRQKGLGGLYIVGCVGGQNREALEAMAKEGWDASSAYGADWRPPSRSAPWATSCAPFEGFIDRQEQIWKFKRGLGLLPDITAVMMGWDSRPWKETPFFWSENTPEKFRDLCLRAKAVMDRRAGQEPRYLLLLERVRRRTLYRAHAGLRVFVPRRDPRRVHRRAQRTS